MGRQKKRIPFTFRSPSHNPSGRHSVPSKEAPRPNFIFIEIAFNAIRASFINTHWSEQR